MGVPRKAGEIVVRPVVPEVVEEQERVIVRRRPEAERATESHARALHRRLGLHEALYRSDRHGGSLSSVCFRKH
jgi:hypothetical protein